MGYKCQLCTHSDGGFLQRLWTVTGTAAVVLRRPFHLLIKYLLLIQGKEDLLLSTLVYFVCLLTPPYSSEFQSKTKGYEFWERSEEEEELLIEMEDREVRVWEKSNQKHYKYIWQLLENVMERHTKKLP